MIRSVLVALLLIAVLILGIAHGIRGLLVAGAVVLAWGAKDSPAWKISEAFLVRLTGSKRRAAVAVMGAVIVVMLAVDVYQATH
jgi:hypothetical protein